jgi:radial spoke head protein 9
LGLQQLLNDSKDGDFEELLFWGRVSGTTRDYYIAMGVTYSKQYEFPTKSYYFASSADMVFKKFRDLNTQHEGEYDGLTGPFIGNAAHIHKSVEPETKDDDVDDKKADDTQRDPLEDTPEEDPNAGFVPINLTEEDRLLYTVLAIENDCSIVPQGALRLTENHEVERNVSFKGLSAENCFTLNKYSHFRNVQSQEKKRALMEDDAVFAADFLDEVWTDKPNGCWSIHKDCNETTAVIRNNEWAGFTAYHRVGS